MKTDNDKRSGNQGAKPKGKLRKVPITIYRTIKDIELLGGMEKVRGQLGDYFDDDVLEREQGFPKISYSQEEINQIVKEI